MIHINAEYKGVESREGFVRIEADECTQFDLLTLYGNIMKSVAKTLHEEMEVPIPKTVGKMMAQTAAVLADFSGLEDTKIC